MGRTGHDLYFAENGVEALELLAQQHIDLLITDINMPQMDGLELLNRLQAYPDLNKFAMSAQRDIEPRLEPLGVADFFEKPLDIKRLRGRVEELLAPSLSFECIKEKAPHQCGAFSCPFDCL